LGAVRARQELLASPRLFFRKLGVGQSSSPGGTGLGSIARGSQDDEVFESEAIA
jgi:hypothetical protein